MSWYFANVLLLQVVVVEAALPSQLALHPSCRRRSSLCPGFQQARNSLCKSFGQHANVKSKQSHSPRAFGRTNAALQNGAQESTLKIPSVLVKSERLLCCDRSTHRGAPCLHKGLGVAVENFNLNNPRYANRKCTTQSLFGDATAKESRHGNRCSSPSRACAQSGWMAEVRWSQKGDRQSCTRKLALKRTFEKGSLLFPKRKLFGDRGLLLW